jgi:hypothetical protein
MPRRARLHGVLVGLVVAGYLVALGTTPAREGLHVLGALAQGAAPPAAPAYRPDPAAVGLPVLPTLRASATQDGDGRSTHAPEHAGPQEPRTASTGHVVRARAETPSPPEGETVDTQETQAPPAPIVPVRVSVDTHRLPDATRVPAPPSLADAPATGDTARLRSVDGSVDTPPPIGRG